MATSLPSALVAVLLLLLLLGAATLADAETVLERMRREKAAYAAKTATTAGREAWEKSNGIGSSAPTGLLPLVKAGDIAAVRSLLATAGSNPDLLAESDRMQNGVMHQTAKIMNNDVALAIGQMLVELNPTMNGKNGRGQTPLAIAVQYGNYDLAKCMLENGAIAQRGQNSGKWSLMDTVAFYNVFAEGQDIPGLLAAKGLRATTIHQAAGVGDVELVKTFLEQDSVSPRQCKDGHRPEACDHPIHWAARSGHADVIRVLLDAGADPSIKDQGEDTPLYLASRYGHTDAGKALLDAGAAHHIGEVAALGLTEDVKRLIAEGVSPDEPRYARSQEPPLCRAAQKGHVDTVLALIEGGAALNGTDKFGDTALDWAIDTTPRGQIVLQTEVMKVLIERGAKGSQKLCAYADSVDELALLERYLEMRKAEYDAAAAQTNAAGDDVESEEGKKTGDNKPKSMAEELTYCEEKRNLRAVSPGEVRPNAYPLLELLDTLGRPSPKRTASAQSDSRDEL